MAKKNKVQDAMDAAKPVDDEDGFSLYGGPANDDPDYDEEVDEGPPPNYGDEYDARPAGISDDVWDAVSSCAHLDPNDRDNGRRLCVFYGEGLGYVIGMGWIVWNGKHWVRDEGELQARLLGQNVVDFIKLEPHFIRLTDGQQKVVDKAAPFRDTPEDDQTAAQKSAIKQADKILSALYNRRARRKTFAISTGNAGRTTAMLAQAASLKRVEQTKLDKDHMRFNVRNGTLVFGREPDPEHGMMEEEDGVASDPKLIGTFAFEQHDRDNMITKMADVDYDPDAKCPFFLKMLEKAHPDHRMRRFLQVFHGFAMLVGGNDEQKLVFHYGTGANGKSAFIEALGRLAGSYRTVVSPDTITGEGQRQGQSASPDIARLFNTRFVTVEELPKNVPLREELIKAVSGGSKMTARFLQKEIFEFEPIFVAILSGNTKPSINGTDNGIWRRLLLVHWGVTIPEEERIPWGQMLDMLDGERSGILNWLIDGLMAYLRDGLDAHTPEAVKDFTKDYRADRDNVSVFFEHCLIKDENEKIQAGPMYKAYTMWCEANALRPASLRSFGDKITELHPHKTRGARCFYIGLRLVDGLDLRSPSDQS